MFHFKNTQVVPSASFFEKFSLNFHSHFVSHADVLFSSLTLTKISLTFCLSFSSFFNYETNRKFRFGDLTILIPNIYFVEFYFEIKFLFPQKISLYFEGGFCVSFVCRFRYSSNISKNLQFCKKILKITYTV